jgi:sugar lactone lactonase YvrE
MESSRGLLTLAGLALAALLTLLTASPAPAAPGDVYAVDRSAEAVWKIGPDGGDAVALAQGEPPFAGSPDGITLGPDGFLYVADEHGKVFKVDRNTGDVSTVTDFGGPNPIDVAFDARGRLLAVDFTPSKIYVVNRATGERTLLFDGPDGTNFNSIAPQRNGTFWLGDEGSNHVWRLTNGVLTEIFEDNGADGVLLSPDERFLYVGTFSDNHFFRYRLSDGHIDQFDLNDAPWSLALLPSNRLIFSGDSTGHLFTVPVGGGTVEPFSEDADLNHPREITVEPRRCAGKLPTVVGTDVAETIKGSKFADVISTLGGNDVVKGLGGKDIVCGGKGKDRLLGGKGKDRLLGGPGRDKLLGGPGRDKLKGGPGRDRQRQ